MWTIQEEREMQRLFFWLFDSSGPDAFLSIFPFHSSDRLCHHLSPCSNSTVDHLREPRFFSGQSTNTSAMCQPNS